MFITHSFFLVSGENFLNPMWSIIFFMLFSLDVQMENVLVDVQQQVSTSRGQCLNMRLAVHITANVWHVMLLDLGDGLIFSTNNIVSKTHSAVEEESRYFTPVL